VEAAIWRSKQRPYLATVDDFVRVFMQCSAYSQFLKGYNPGTGPSKEELKLRRAQRFAVKI
jgi:hypothetical protein